MLCHQCYRDSVYLSRQWFEVTEVPRVGVEEEQAGILLVIVDGDDCELDVYWKVNPHSQNQPRNSYLSW